MKLMFCTSNLPGAVLIRAVTWSKWSHVAVVLEDGSAIEATWPRVRRVDVEEIKAKHSKWCVVDVPLLDEQAAIDFAMAQLGKPYDWTALFGILFHRKWDDKEKWFCSELVTSAIEAGGLNLFRKEFISRISPQFLWIMDWPIVAKSW